MARPKINPAAAVRKDPAEDYLDGQLKPKQQYTRTNIFIPEDNISVYEDFKIYAKSINMSVSELLNLYMADLVQKHAAEIEEAKNRFASARRRYEGR